MIQDVRRVQGELEGRFLAEQPEIEKDGAEARRRLARPPPATT